MCLVAFGTNCLLLCRWGADAVLVRGALDETTKSAARLIANVPNQESFESLKTWLDSNNLLKTVSNTNTAMNEFQGFSYTGGTPQQHVNKFATALHNLEVLCVPAEPQSMLTTAFIFLKSLPAAAA